MALFHIFSTGTELSSGRTRDDNGPYLARRLIEEGYDVTGITLLPDDVEILRTELEQVLQSSDASILMTGGLGPTEDDLTVDLLSQTFGLPTLEDSDALTKLEHRLAALSRAASLNAVRRQVRILENCTVLKNDTGFAPGIAIHLHKENITKHHADKPRILASMPGFPQEMRPMFEDHLLPMIKTTLPDAGRFRRSFILYGINESRFQKDFIATADRSEAFRWGVTTQNAYIRVVFDSPDQNEVESLYLQVKEKYEKFYTERPAMELLHDRLIEKKLTIAGAESCTGGLVGKLLTDLAGSSSYFLGSAVTYSNEAKVKLLGVKQETLERFGAVSEQCAKEMAEGARSLYGADIGFAVTGIAGPGGGSEEKPAGTVYVAISHRETEVFKLFYPAERERVRNNTAHTVLFRLLQRVSG